MTDEAGLDRTQVVTTYDEPGEYVVTARVSGPSTGTSIPAEVTITAE